MLDYLSTCYKIVYSYCLTPFTTLAPSLVALLTVSHCPSCKRHIWFSSHSNFLVVRRRIELLAEGYRPTVLPLNYPTIMVRKRIELLYDNYKLPVLPLNYPTSEGYRTRICISGFVAQYSFPIILTLRREGRIRTHVYVIRSHVRHPGYATPPNCRRDSHPLMPRLKAWGLGYFVFSSTGDANRDRLELPSSWLTVRRFAIKLPAHTKLYYIYCNNYTK